MRGKWRRGEDARRVVVRRSAEEERQRDPPVGERRARRDRDQDRLDEQWLRDHEPAHAVQDPEVRRVLVLRGVVGQPPVEHCEDAVLYPDRNVEHDTPGYELRDDAREHTRDEHAEEEAGEHDRERGCAPLGRGEVHGEGHENLGCYGRDADEEGENLEHDEVVCDCEADREG